MDVDGKQRRVRSFGRSLGRIAQSCEGVVRRIFSYLDGGDLLQCAVVSWMFNTTQLDEELWRTVCLWRVDPVAKVADFCFHGSWKATVMHPGRYAGATWFQQHQTSAATAALATLHDGNRFGSTSVMLNDALTTANSFDRDKKVLSVVSGGRRQVVATQHRTVCDAFANVYRPLWAAPPPRRGAAKWYDLRGLDVSTLPMFIRGVDRREKLSLQAFIEEYERPNRPVVITGMIDHWKAGTEWTPARFPERFPDLPLRTNGRSSNGRRYRMRAFDYFSYAAQCNGEKFIYVFDKKIFFRRPDLLTYYEVPVYFQEDMFATMSEEDRPDYRWLLIGPNGSGSPLHQDPHRSSAWNAVISGCKRVTFYPPHVIPPGVDEELIQSDYYASDDMMEWYRHTLPKVTDPSQLPMEVLVHPGEILFIPSGWWHSVMNIGITVAVTQNYCSRRTFPFVAADMNLHASKTLRKDFKVALMESPFYEYAHDIVVDRPRPSVSIDAMPKAI